MATSRITRSVESNRTMTYSYPVPASVGFLIAEGRTGEKPVNLLGRCKRCRTGLRISDAVRGHAGKDVGCKASFKFANGSMAFARDNYWGNGILVDCPECCIANGPTYRVVIMPVKGRFNAAKKCDARCMSATGHDCECQCGGKNHGSHHG